MPTPLPPTPRGPLWEIFALFQIGTGQIAKIVEVSDAAVAQWAAGRRETPAMIRAFLTYLADTQIAYVEGFCAMPLIEIERAIGRPLSQAWLAQLHAQAAYARALFGLVLEENKALLTDEEREAVAKWAAGQDMKELRAAHMPEAMLKEYRAVQGQKRKAAAVRSAKKHTTARARR